MLMSFFRQLISQRRLSTILLGLLSAAKIITDMLGWQVISNQQVNDIVNGAAALGTVITVMMSHMKHPSSSSPTVEVKKPDISLLGAATGASSSSSAQPKQSPLVAERASNGYARPPKQ